MKYIRLGKEGREVSRIVLGCMRIADKPLSRVEELLKTSLDRARFCCMRTFSNEK